MIDIPIGKALVPVAVDKMNGCEGCVYKGEIDEDCYLPCLKSERSDKKTVIFKLVDYREAV